MRNLIEALTIISKYLKDGMDTEFPTNCGYDCLYVPVDDSLLPVSQKDLDRLKDLGFYFDEPVFYSYRFGSN